jgi:hypothetical protein
MSLLVTKWDALANGALTEAAIRLITRAIYSAERRRAWHAAQLFQ